MVSRSSRKRRLLWIVPLALVLAITVGFLVYAGDYYRAGQIALDALDSDERVRVSRTDYGWHFDGPSDSDALVFYPGAKVEATAYAPLLHALAGAGMDACLVVMPLRFAIFGANKARGVMGDHDYPRWYLGGHSLGGAMAARFASSHGDAVEGVILLAAYADKPLGGDLVEVLLYGSEDQVLSMGNVEKCRANAPKRYIEHVVQGGNHAQFGDYGPQSGDGNATIAPEQQWDETVRTIGEAVGMKDLSGSD